MGKKYDVMDLGELLIDFTESGISKNGMKLFEQNPKYFTLVPCL